jgi:hypothetical protein
MTILFNTYWNAMPSLRKRLNSATMMLDVRVQGARDSLWLVVYSDSGPRCLQLRTKYVDVRLRLILIEEINSG